MITMPSTSSRLCSGLRSLLLCALVCGSAVQGADGRESGEGRGHRNGVFRNAQLEARGARQAERLQQRAAGRPTQPREMPNQRVPEREVPQQLAPPIPPPEAPAQGRPGRLTPDERRALRQQINEAGRDVYRPTRP